MEEDKELQGATGTRDSTETAESRRGPRWKGWILSILVAIALSVIATLLLGGTGSFRPDRAAAKGAAGGGCGSGPGSGCCPPADPGK